MFRTDRVTPPLAAANVIRNIALHEGMPDERANKFASRISSRLIRSLGVDPNDPGQIVASQLGFTPKFSVRFNPRNEVLSEDPIHLFLFLVAGALFFAYRRRIGRETGWFGLGVVGAFVMYCALLRWSPWNARYQIPVFILGAVFAAVVLVRILPRWAVNAVSAGVLLIALGLAIANDTRPLITKHGLSGGVLTTPRDQTYFFDSHREIADSWIAAARAARASDCRSIGLDANLLHFEYPMMAMLRSDNVPRRIRYVDVENSSSRYARGSEPPVCMVICLNCLHHPEKLAQYSARLPNTQAFGNVALFSERAGQ